MSQINSQLKSLWENDFYKKWDNGDFDCKNENTPSAIQVEKFIHSLLSRQAEQQRKEIIHLIKAMPCKEECIIFKNRIITKLSSKD